MTLTKFMGWEIWIRYIPMPIKEVRHCGVEPILEKGIYCCVKCGRKVEGRVLIGRHTQETVLAMEKQKQDNEEWLQRRSSEMLTETQRCVHCQHMNEGPHQLDEDGKSIFFTCKACEKTIWKQVD